MHLKFKRHIFKIPTLPNDILFVTYGIVYKNDNALNMFHQATKQNNMWTKLKEIHIHVNSKSWQLTQLLT